MFSYSGNSMTPLFKTGDLLLYDSWSYSHLARGDVILFKKPGSPERTIVHRIIGLENEKVTTKGDSNLYPDPWLLQPSAVIGKVVQFQRNKSVRKVWGGKVGLAWADFISFKNWMDKKLSDFLHPVYNSLTQFSFIPKLISPFLNLQILRIDSPKGSSRILMMGKKVIGTKDVGQNFWKIKRPYKLIVNLYALDSQV